MNAAEGGVCEACDIPVRKSGGGRARKRHNLNLFIYSWFHILFFYYNRLLNQKIANITSKYNTNT